VTNPKAGLKQSDAGKLLRLFRLLNLLWNTSNGLRVDEIAHLQNVSKRTAYRDLDILDQSGFVLIQDERSGRFRLSQARESGQLLGFDRAEADLLLTAMAGTSPSKGRERLITKLRSFSTLPNPVLPDVETNNSETPYSLLHEAIRRKQCVLLMAYRSAHSRSERNRNIEPYAFSEDLSSVWAYEPSASSNKTFKLDRIGQVRVLRESWKHEHLHQSPERDPFGMPLGPEAIEIKLILGNLSAQLFREEFPSHAHRLQEVPVLPNESPSWLLHLRVGSMQGIGRFVLGLIDDVHILSPASFKKYLRNRIGDKLR